MKHFFLPVLSLLAVISCSKLPEQNPGNDPDNDKDQDPKISFTVSYNLPVHYESLDFVSTTMSIHDPIHQEVVCVINDRDQIRSGYFCKTLSYNVKDLPVNVTVHVEPVVRELPSDTFPFAFMWARPVLYADYSTVMTPEGLSAHPIALPSQELESIDTTMPIKTFEETRCKASDYTFRLTFGEHPEVTPVL